MGYKIDNKDMPSFKAMEERRKKNNETNVKEIYIVEVDINKATKLSKLVSDCIEKIDESLEISTFAKAIAIVLFEDYGSHNYEYFLTVLEKELN